MTTTRRHDSTELAHVWQPRPPASTPMDAPGLVASILGQVQVERGMRRWSGCPTATRSATT
jgi:hypothetical protein